jgi:hypothetical protein
MAAAYRFLRNEQVGWDDMLTAHAQPSRERIREHAVVLCLQNTTELDYRGQAIERLGPLSCEAQRGLYLRPTYVVTPEREPLGVIDAWLWAREPKQADGTQRGLRESVRWVESYERMAEQARELPATRHVAVGDRELDILALLLKAHDMDLSADYLLRCQHNRVLPEGGTLWERGMETAPLGHLRSELPAGRGRPVRRIEQELRTQHLEINNGPGGSIPVTCLIASEVNAPAGITPVVWRLLSNCEAPSLEAAAELIDWYRARWEIELFSWSSRRTAASSGCNWPTRGGCRPRWPCAWSLPGASTASCVWAAPCPICRPICCSSPKNGEPPSSSAKSPCRRVRLPSTPSCGRLPGALASSDASATASRVSRRSGWACKTSLSSSRARAMCRKWPWPELCAMGWINASTGGGKGLHVS